MPDTGLLRINVSSRNDSPNSLVALVLHTLDGPCQRARCPPLLMFASHNIGLTVEAALHAQRPLRRHQSRPSTSAPEVECKNLSTTPQTPIPNPWPVRTQSKARTQTRLLRILDNDIYHSVDPALVCPCQSMVKNAGAALGTISIARKTQCAAN